jgi:hypothetical protein
MDTLRFVGIAFGLFVAVFFGGQWLLAPRPLKPDARLPTFQRVDPNDPRIKMEQTSFASDNDSVRDALRHATLDAASALDLSPCDEGIRARYIRAATNYARAWLSIAPCVGSETCGSSDGPRLERAQRSFGSPLDRRVREAMRKAHQTTTFSTGDFPKDVAGLLAEFAADPSINPRTTGVLKSAFSEMRDSQACGPRRNAN